jgi:hypothetical protein
MSRCNICDYSQSADSLYNNGLAISHNHTSNRVIYSAALKLDICVQCLEAHTDQGTFWESLSEEEDVFEVQADEGSDYQGCSEVEAS